MRYNINDKVVVISDNEFKIISDSEIILGVEIYYMTDKTSYCVSELILDPKEIITFLDDNKESIKNFINTIVDTKKIIENGSIWFREQMLKDELPKKQIKPVKKWFMF